MCVVASVFLLGRPGFTFRYTVEKSWFAATGTRIVATLAKLLAETRAKRGLISICTARGMGVSAILER